MQPRLIFLFAWLAWALSWAAASFWSSRTHKRVTLRAALIYRLPIIIGAVLLYHRTAEELGLHRLFHVGYDGAYVLAAATILGILFAWWARIHLGALWSGAVTVKQNHRVIDTGPYGLVRHPIYTGLLLSTFATAIALATVPSLTGALLITYGIWLKARMEERFLAAQLGEAAYATYRSRVPMLVPFTA